MAPVAAESKFTVRRMKPADASAVAAIVEQSPEAGRWTPADFERLTQGDCDAWVVEERGIPVGFLEERRVAEEAEILNLAVSPNRRRRGVGSLLLAAVLAEAQAADVKRVYLEVRASNAAAIAFYQRHDFLPAGRRPSYYTQPVEDALVLLRRLGEAAG